MQLAHIAFFLLTALTPAASTQVEAPLTSTTSIAAYARVVQARYGLGDDFYYTLERESQGWQNKQSIIPNPKGPNGREDSWGICQIHLPAHSTISWSQAMNPAWCIEWSAKEFVAGRAWQWTEWQRLQASTLKASASE